MSRTACRKASSASANGQARGLSDLDPIYRQLLDRPVTMTLGLIGPDGRVSLTPMWFDYEGDKVLVNTASHRRNANGFASTRSSPSCWSIPKIPTTGCRSGARWRRRCGSGRTAASYVTRQLDRIWTKYTGNPAPYGLRDPAIDEKRVLFICRIDRIATFGKP